MTTKHLTNQEFINKVANYKADPETWTFVGDKPCLVDFYASWCGPCKMIAPLLEELAKEYDGVIDIYKVDTEAEEELSDAFGIQTIPSLLFCPKDDDPQMMQGVLGKADLKKVIEQILLKK